ncbi:MAG: cupin domain-containing protein [Limnobacter sp.]|nr:cupin domain-containing protein [Limnobacter sp.]
MKRQYQSHDFYESNVGEPIRSVVVETVESVVVAWHLNPGQEIAPHIHPHGQDTWYVVSGKGEYLTDIGSAKLKLDAGDIVIAPSNCIHSVVNTGNEALKIISVVSPAAAGYEQIDV